MYIRPTLFITKSIGQDNAVPCAPATITVTLSTSSPLYTTCQPCTGAPRYNAITINGLIGSTSCFSNFTSPDSMFSLQKNDSNSGLLAIQLEQNTKAGCEYVFSFKIRHCADVSQGLTLGGTITLSNYVNAKNNPQVISGVWVAGLLSSVPMKVDSLIIDSAMIGQSSDLPCANNTIYVQLKITQPLYKACNPRITIAGLKQSQTASTSFLAVKFFAPGSMPSAPTGDANGIWSLNTGRLELPLSGFVDAESANEFSFGFSLVNNLGQQCEATREDVTFQVSILTNKDDCARKEASICEQRTVSTSKLNCFPKAHAWSTSLTYQGSRTCSDDALYVRPINFKTHIRQDSPYPCDTNVITVSVSPSTPLPFKCLPCLTISGLFGSLSPDSSMTLSGTEADLFDYEAKWTQAGSLTACAKKDIPASNATFSFRIVNPVDGCTRNRAISLMLSLTKSNQASTLPQSALTCSSTYSMQACNDVAPTNIYAYNTPCHQNLQECWPLNVRGLVFEEKSIGQSTPHPGCLNTISVTMRTNVPLVVSDQCQPKLTIEGLTGAIVNGNACAGTSTGGELALTAGPGQCDVGALSAFLFRSGPDSVSGFGKWLVGSPSNSIELFSAQRSQAGQQYILSFQVVNPMQAQAGCADINIQSLSVSDGRAGIPSFPTSSDVCFRPKTEQQQCVLPSKVAMDKSMAKPCCLCDVAEGDACPMKVKAPNFCMKRICHSSNNPCANNTVTVTLSATTAIKAGQIITLSGFYGSIAVGSDGKEIKLGSLQLKDLYSGGSDHNLFFTDPTNTTKRGFAQWDAQVYAYYTSVCILHVSNFL